MMRLRRMTSLRFDDKIMSGANGPSFVMARSAVIERQRSHLSCH